MTDLRVELAGLTLRNPVILASGTVGYGAEYRELVEFETVGAFVTKTITLEPRSGNAPPRLVEAGGGLLNAIGLENVGLERFLDEKLPESAELPAPLIASIAGTSAEEVATLAEAVGARTEVDALEINISCPNVERAACPLWDDPESTALFVARARASTTKPLFLKLSPQTANATVVARSAADAGTDALIVANTMTGMRIDLDARRPVLGNVTGGLSGPPLKPVNLALVWRIAGSVDIPVVGSGGAGCAGDVLEYMMAGATAVEMGTALYGDPGSATEIVGGLVEFMERNGVERIDTYIGAARGEAA
ncbi:MAG: dihydroorotate dehydrogenase [Candidatus Eisenbacteria bacterium]|nr:dihydroorotate dehydrogenase [Candidatus Eisenbacteria bacterium]